MDKKHTNGTAMKIKAILLILIQCCLSTTANSALPPDYKAIYNVDKFGTTVGRSTVTLNQNDNEIHYSQNVKLVGFISYFKKDRVSENSLITKGDDGLLFNRYQYTHSNSKKNRNSLFEATWMKDENNELIGKITGNSRGIKTSLTTNEPIWDTLSFQLALIDDVSSNNSTYNYNVISRGVIKQYKFSTIGEETIEIDDSEHKTIQLERRSNNKITKIWLAKNKHYIPVLIEQYKDGDLDSTMTIDTIMFNNAPDKTEYEDDEF